MKKNNMEEKKFSNEEEENFKDILFEQYYKGCPGLSKEKKEYFFNCINLLTIFNDMDLVDSKINNGQDCFLISGSISGKKDKVNYVYYTELYEEQENSYLIYTEIKNINGTRYNSSIELFTKNGDNILHELYVGEEKKIVIGEYSINDLNFVDNKKNELMKK